MRKDWKYILYVGGAVLLYVLVQLASPKQYNWTVTFSHDDRNPYGAYALYELMPSLFHERKIDHDFKTVYEVKDELKPDQNIFILASEFQGDKTDTEVLLKHVERGGNVFISAESFSGTFRDTLKLKLRDSFISDFTSQKNDSTWIEFSNPSVREDMRYWFAKGNTSMHFHEFDTLNTTAVARNSDGDPVTVRVKRGKGNFILNTTPLAFTNIYMLASNNHEFVSATLSALPDKDLFWTEYYHLGRMESGSPLRFILTTEPLAWAYYLTMTAVLVFMIFEAKRKQRIIPIVKPLQNTSLEFVSTIGNLYYQHGDHKNIADKKIAFLLDFIRTNYLVRTNILNEEFYETISKKSGHRLDEIKELFKLVILVDSATAISSEQLMALNKKIENFFERK